MTTHILFRVADRKRINSSVLCRAVEMAWMCTRTEIEGQPNSFGLILGDPVAISDTIGNEFVEEIQNSQGLTYDCSQLINCCGPLMDWKAVSVIVNGTTGKIEGLADLAQMGLEDPFEHITRITNVIAIVVKPANTVRVYYNGALKVQIITNRKRGQIEERRLEPLQERVKSLTTVNRRIVVKIVDLALRISEDRLGALFFLGETRVKDEFRYAVGKVDSIFSVRKTSDMTTSKLKSRALEDGAMWVNNKGTMKGYGLKLLGPGGRHAIARYMTKRNPGISAIVVSQDGEISLVFKGRSKRLATKIFKYCEFHPLGSPP